MTPDQPTRSDPVVAGLSEVVGGPMGDHGTRHPWWTPVRVILVMVAVTFALGMVQKTDCYSASWQNGEDRYATMCYSDIPYLYLGRGFAELEWPYIDDQAVRDRYQTMEYPVLISYWAFGAAAITHGLEGFPDLRERNLTPYDDLWSKFDLGQESNLFVVVNALGFAALALLAAWCLAKVNPRRGWDAAAFALSPLLALTALINWDLLAVALVAAALLAWSRSRPMLTGVLIGLGIAAKLYPLFLLGGIVVFAFRDRRQLGPAVKAWIGAGLAWALVQLPAYLSSPEQWKVFWRFNSERAADLGSVWIAAEGLFNTTFSASTINQASWAFFGAWCLAVLALGLAAPRTPSLAQLGFLLVAGFLIVNKVYSPQYVLWLLPLAALARPQWRDQIVWQACELFYFASVWWYLGGYLASPGTTDVGFYWLAIAVRVAGEVYLVVRVIRDILRPDQGADQPNLGASEDAMSVRI